MNGWCRSCGAAILWCRTANGRTMPVDARPSAGGNLVVVGNLVRHAELGELQMGEWLHASHFATCPDHTQWRAPR